MSNNLGDNFEESEIGKNDNVTDSGSDEDEKNCFIETCNENVVKVDDEQNASFEEHKKFLTEEDGHSIIKPNVFTSKVEHNVNDSTAEVVKEQEIEEDNVSNDESVPDLTNKLRLDELLILFSWLPLDDLVNVRRVCHIWRVAAQDKSLWRNRVLDVNSGSGYERKIKLMPYIENIKGYGNNDLLHVILENVIKLKKLDVKFFPLKVVCVAHREHWQLLPLNVKRISQRYPELESITLYTSDPDLLESLDILKSSSHLKEVRFFSGLREDEWTSFRPHFMYIFTDTNNFPALTSLKLSGDGHLEDAMNYPCFRNILYNIIKNRSQQLSILKLNFSVSESPEILDAISQCVKLQTLHLSLDKGYSNLGNVRDNVNIERMTQLRSLFLFAWYQDLNFFTTLKDSLYKGFWSKLTEVNIIVNIAVNIGLLRAIVDNAKSLKSLTFEHRGCHISDDELENINTLVKLEDLVLIGIQNITEKGICYITKCHKLENINLVSLSSDISINSNFIRDMLLQLKNLRSITTQIDGYKVLFLENRQEIKRHIASLVLQHH